MSAAAFSAVTVRSAALDGVPPDRLYRILQLRSEVFVVEQDCAFLDPDGRDLDPGVIQWWLEDDRGGVIAALRVLPLAEGWEIGRVVTAAPARKQGHARHLLLAALASCGRPVVINAQSRLVPWYTTFGFGPSGPEFLEDGIAHVPMRLV